LAIQPEPFGSRRDVALAVGLFLVALWLYIASAGGHGYSLDGEMYLRVAESVTARGDISLESAPPDLLAPRGSDGRRYSKYAPGQSMVEAPVLLAFQLASRAATGLDLTWEAARAWAPTVTNALLGALAVALLFLEARSLGASQGRALVLAGALGFATHLWWHVRSDLSEPLQACLLLGLFATLRRVMSARGEPGARLVLACGVCMGALVLAKATYLLLVPIVVIAVVCRPWPPRPLALLRDLVVAGLPTAVGLAAYLLYNVARYGSPAYFGYDEPFDTPLLVGLYGWFLSSGKSVFLYAPPVLLAAWAAPRFWRERVRESVLILALTMPLVVAYAMFWSWDGDFAWGPRFAAPLLTLWLLPLATARGGRAWRAALGLTVAAGIFVQVLGVAIDPTRYLWELSQQVTPRVHGGVTGERAYRLMLQDVHFVPEFSPVAAHWWLLRLTLDQSDPSAAAAVGQGSSRQPPWVTNHEREDWMPPKPERMTGLDVWLLTDAGRQAVASQVGLMLALVAIPVCGAVLLVAGAMWPRRTRPR
jgi:hypothetical protein